MKRFKLKYKLFSRSEVIAEISKEIFGNSDSGEVRRHLELLIKRGFYLHAWASLRSGSGVELRESKDLPPHKLYHFATLLNRWGLLCPFGARDVAADSLPFFAAAYFDLILEDDRD